MTVNLNAFTMMLPGEAICSFITSSPTGEPKTLTTTRWLAAPVTVTRFPFSLRFVIVVEPVVDILGHDAVAVDDTTLAVTAFDNAEILIELMLAFDWAVFPEPVEPDVELPAVKTLLSIDVPALRAETDPPVAGNAEVSAIATSRPGFPFRSTFALAVAARPL